MQDRKSESGGEGGRSGKEGGEREELHEVGVVVSGRLCVVVLDRRAQCMIA